MEEGHPETEGFRGVEAFRRRGGPSTRVRTRAIPPNPRAARAMRSRHGRAESALVRPSPVRASVPQCEPPPPPWALHIRERASKESAQRGESSSFRFADQGKS